MLFVMLRSIASLKFLTIFEENPPPIKYNPAVASKFNLILDENELIRVKGKMRNTNTNSKERYPLLLDKYVEMILPFLP